ncbi:MAG: deoxyribodipyrimidine photo-lyase [Betaproteobacteria bacterium]|nr:deoxyribodipyrimidine photo-lyase [Betaproteobacteria bacterium]
MAKTVSGNTPGPALFWFRRDLRDEDNAGLSRALAAHAPVYCVFVFDTAILAGLPGRADRRVEFIWHSVQSLRSSLEDRGGGLIVLHGDARQCIPELAFRLGVRAVHTNRDYEPEAVARDEAVATTLAARGISFHAHKDQVIFECRELLTQGGKPYVVFTPYRNAWLRAFTEGLSVPWPLRFESLARAEGGKPWPALESLGFQPTNLLELGICPGMEGARRLLADFLPRLGQYQRLRDYPGKRGVSYLSVHLRFGTVSIRELVRLAMADGSPGAQAWLNELIWREFYFSILANFPRVTTRAFRAEYDRLVFDNDPDHFRAWQEGRTGYPIVDAGMRQLQATGYMHNRLRMITASFLVKDLGVDWRWGERHFAEHLNDYDLAANNGGWQWSASTGCDAQPWFRIFNPVAQGERFDPDGQFVRRYVPELARVPVPFIHEPWKLSPLEQQAAGCIIGRDYPAPVVDHAVAREKTLKRYQR